MKDRIQNKIGRFLFRFLLNLNLKATIFFSSDSPGCYLLSSFRLSADEILVETVNCIINCHYLVRDSYEVNTF